MSPESDVITIEILGARLQLRGGEHPEAVRKVGEYVRDRVHELAGRAPSIPPLQIALLVAMNLADDLLQQSQQETADYAAVTDKVNRILEKTDFTFADSEF